MYLKKHCTYIGGNHELSYQKELLNYHRIVNTLVLHSHAFDWKKKKWCKWYDKEPNYKQGFMDYKWHVRGFLGNWNHKDKNLGKKYANKAFEYAKEWTGIREMITGHKHYTSIQHELRGGILLTCMPPGRTPYTLKRNGSNLDNVNGIF